MDSNSPPSTRIQRVFSVRAIRASESGDISVTLRDTNADSVSLEIRDIVIVFPDYTDCPKGFEINKRVLVSIESCDRKDMS